MNTVQLISALTNHCSHLYKSGRLSHFRGLIVSRALYDEIKVYGSYLDQFHGRIVAEFIRGSRRVRFPFYITVSDTLPRDVDYILTPLLREHYEQYYRGCEPEIYRRSSIRRKLVFPGLEIAEWNPLEGSIWIDDDIFHDVTFETILQLAVETADWANQKQLGGWIDTAFASLLKALDVSRDESWPTYKLDDERYHRYRETYDLFIARLRDLIYERFLANSFMVTQPEIRHVDLPELYSYAHAKRLPDNSHLELSIGRLLMFCDYLTDPHEFQIRGIICDESSRSVNYYIFPEFTTTDPRRFLHHASRFFMAQEVREFLMQCRVRGITWSETKELDRQIRDDWNAVPDLRGAGYLKPTRRDNGGIITARFTDTRGNLTPPIVIAATTENREWTKIRNLFFPRGWQEHKLDDAPDPTCLIEIE